MGAHIEKELTRVQKEYAQRRTHSWKWGIGVAAFLCAAGLLFSFRGTLKNEGISPGNASEVLVVRSPAVVSLNASYNVPFRLTGITSRGGEAMALINGQVVAVGDSLPGKAVVKSIGDGAVLLEVRGKQVRLEL